jgi:hypothetical protein
MFDSNSAAVASGKAVTPVRLGVVAWALVSLTILLPACSSSRGSSEVRLGSDEAAPAATRSATERASQPAWQQPSRFDADGAPQPTYRGGRDPVTGRAQERTQDWAPAAPHQPTPTHSAALPPLGAPGPAHQPYGYQPYQPHAAHQQHTPPPYAAASPAQMRDTPARETMAGGNSIEVRPGDTLYRIARAYGVTVPALMQANNLPGETIKPGQRLTIPPR